MTVTTIRIERDKLTRFGEICRAEHLSISQAFRRMVDERIASVDSAEEAAA